MEWKSEILSTWNIFLFWCFRTPHFLVHGLKHAFPGRLLHHAGGEETTENAQFTLPERLCGPARPPYNCQKHMGATEPQREMKSLRSIDDKWMHWVTSGCRGELVCASVCLCVSSLDLLPSEPVATLLPCEWIRGSDARGWEYEVRWMLSCVCLYIKHQWLGVTRDWRRILIGQQNSIEQLNSGHCCLSCLVLSHPSGKINVTYICHITLFEIHKTFSFVHEKFTGEIFLNSLPLVAFCGSVISSFDFEYLCTFCL